MPRSSRHRSHRSRKHSRDRSDSEEESPRERRAREEETSATSGGRVSRDPEPEKRRSLHEHAGKEAVVNTNGDNSGERKRKAMEEVVVVADRWNGGKENDDKRSKGEESGPVESDKSSKSKVTTDSRGRSTRRYEGSNERDEDRGGKNDSTKGKSWKESSRRESSSQYKDGKERDSDKDREVQDSRHDKSDGLHSRKHGSRTGSGAEELAVKKYTKTNEKQAQDVLPSAETEKGPEKHTRRRDDSEDKDKWLEDSRDFDDRRLSSRDHSRNRSYKDERHDNTKYKGKYRVDDRDQNHRDDKYQDEWSSKDRVSDKSDRGLLKDENKPQESHYRKTKLQDTDHNGISYVDDHDSKLKDSRGRKRYSDEKDDHGDPKLRGQKERYEVEKNSSGTSRTSSHNDKPRSGYPHSEKSDSSPKNIRLKSSTSSSAYAGNDHSRDISKIEESMDRGSAPEERSRPIAVAKGEYIIEIAASSKYDRTPRSDVHTSPSSGRRFSERSPSKYDRIPRRNLDIEIGQRCGSSKDGDIGELASEKQIPDDVSQTDARELTPIGSSSFNQRSSYISDRSPNHLRPPPPVRLGMEGPSVLGPYQDDNKGQGSDYRSYNRYKRVGGDHGYGRGHVNAWKGAPNWSSPVANNFIPLQHGPPPAGFHPSMSQFPAPPLFGVRPSMDLTHGGVSYHMHDMAERFTGHGRPFGWHKPVDQLCHPQMQIWDGSNGMFNNESRMYGRQEWDENGQPMSSRAWEMSSEMWKEQTNNVDIPVSKEQDSSTHSPADEQVQPKRLPTENTETKQSSDAPASKTDDAESSQKAVTKKLLVPSSMQDAKLVNYVAHYLARIDISPDLAGFELYKKCMSQLGSVVAKDACNLTTTYGCFQMNKDSNIVKMKSSSAILKSFFPAAKDVLFKKAISLYQKQNGMVNEKHACSREPKHESPLDASENKMVLVPENDDDIVASQGLCGVYDPANNTKAENDGAVEVGSKAKDEKLEIVAECNDGLEVSEASIGEEEIRGARLIWIPNSDENTH